MDYVQWYATASASFVGTCLAATFIWALVAGDKFHRTGEPMPWKIILAGLSGPAFSVIVYYFAVKGGQP